MLRVGQGLTDFWPGHRSKTCGESLAAGRGPDRHGVVTGRQAEDPIDASVVCDDVRARHVRQLTFTGGRQDAIRLGANLEAWKRLAGSVGNEASNHAATWHRDGDRRLAARRDGNRQSGSVRPRGAIRDADVSALDDGDCVPARRHRIEEERSVVSRDRRAARPQLGSVERDAHTPQRLRFDACRYDPADDAPGSDLRWLRTIPWDLSRNGGRRQPEQREQHESGDHRRLSLLRSVTFF